MRRWLLLPTTARGGPDGVRQPRRHTFEIAGTPAIGDLRAIAGSQTAGLGGGLRTAHFEGLGVLDNRNSVLAFGPFRLFPAERRLEREGSPVRLGGRALDLLIVLVERAGEIVPNRALLATVWPDVNVEESSLRFHIKNLRKALGDTQSDTRYVTNVPGRGYCFAARVDRMPRGGQDRRMGARAGRGGREEQPACPRNRDRRPLG